MKALTNKLIDIVKDIDKTQKVFLEQFISVIENNKASTNIVPALGKILVLAKKNANIFADYRVRSKCSDLLYELIDYLASQERLKEIEQVLTFIKKHEFPRKEYAELSFIYDYHFTNVLNTYSALIGNPPSVDTKQYANAQDKLAHKAMFKGTLSSYRSQFIHQVEKLFDVLSDAENFQLVKYSDLAKKYSTSIHTLIENYLATDILPLAQRRNTALRLIEIIDNFKLEKNKKQLAEMIYSHLEKNTAALDHYLLPLFNEEKNPFEEYLEIPVYSPGGEIIKNIFIDDVLIAAINQDAKFISNENVLDSNDYKNYTERIADLFRKAKQYNVYHLPRFKQEIRNTIINFLKLYVEKGNYNNETIEIIESTTNAAINAFKDLLNIFKNNNLISTENELVVYGKEICKILDKNLKDLGEKHNLVAYGLIAEFRTRDLRGFFEEFFSDIENPNLDFIEGTSNQQSGSDRQKDEESPKKEEKREKKRGLQEL